MKVKKLLLLGLMTAIGTSLSAGTVKMKTSRAAGQNISFAVNSGLSLTLTWGDGSTEQLTSTGQLQTVSVKNEQLTISSEKDITSLYVAENDLTTLDISGSAKSLRTLCCADNQLTTLSLSGCTNLVILDCQGNQLKSVSNPSSKMQDLNVADNQLTSHGLSSVANLLSMVCANNNMTSIGSLANMVNLTSLFCQGNKITGFTKLDNLVNLKHIIASNNNLKSLNLSTLTQLEDLWVSDNQLTTLDLSTTKKLVGLVAANNQLNTITWDYVSARKNVKYADVSKNILPFNSLPNLYNTTVGTYVVDGAVGPQNPVELIAGSIEVNQKAGSDFTTRIVRSGWNNITKPEVKAVDGGGKELQNGVDFKFENFMDLTFLTGPYNDVVLTLTSASFPDFELVSTPFNVTGGSDGIETVTIPTEIDENAAIFDLQGRRMNASSLKKGIYVVNGKKVIIR